MIRAILDRLRGAETVCDMPPDHAAALPYAEAVRQVYADFDAYRGKLIRPAWVTSADLAGDVSSPRLVCRVIETDAADLRNDTGGHLDPYWNLAVVSDPDNVTRGATAVWTLGPAVEIAPGTFSLPGKSGQRDMRQSMKRQKEEKRK